MRENRGSRGNVNCLVCPGFLLSACHPPHRPEATTSTQPLASPCPLTRTFAYPSPSQVPAPLSPLPPRPELTPEQGQSRPKDVTSVLEQGQADGRPGVSGGRQESGCRQPTWQVWQQVTETGQGETRFQRQESSPWKELRPQAGNQAGTQFPETGHQVEVQWQRTKLEPSYKNRQQSWEWPAGRKWSIYNRRKSETTLMSKSRGLF